ncbi:MAG: hypothetical protein ABI343_19060, partial [Burkholderiaceae bacterium]
FTRMSKRVKNLCSSSCITNLRSYPCLDEVVVSGLRVGHVDELRFDAVAIPGELKPAMMP